MNVEVKLFAQARDLAGTGQLSLVLPEGGTVADLRHALREKVPELKALIDSLLIAIDHDYAVDSTVISESSDLACFPPVSGG